MYGLLFLIVTGLYLIVVVGLLFWVKPKWGKALVLIASILIPNADDWYYRHELAQYCKSEAGVRVYEHVSRREGLTDIAAWYSEDSLRDISVAFVEWPKNVPDGKGRNVTVYLRSDLLPDGGASMPRQVPNYSAPFEMVHFEDDAGQFIEKKHQIRRVADKKIVAEYKSLYYYGGWYPRVLVGRGSLNAGCGGGGKVLTRQQWVEKDSGAFETGFRDLNKFINQTFSAD